MGLTIISLVPGGTPVAIVVGDGGGANELVTNHRANDHLRGKRRVGHDEYVVCNVLVGESAQTDRSLFILKDERSASLINSQPEVVSTHEHHIPSTRSCC